MSQIQKLVDQISINLIHFLENHQGVRNVHFKVQEPVSNTQLIHSWPSQLPVSLDSNFLSLKSQIKLPEDYKAFLSCCNGLTLTYEMQNLPFGYLHINSLEEMSSIDKESLITLREMCPLVVCAFHIDLRPNNGRVALVFKREERSLDKMVTEIWFQDLATEWFFITFSFTQYFRLSLLHLGVPHWQYAFTSSGLPPQSRMWFAFLSPERLEIDKHGNQQAKEGFNRSVSVSLKKESKKSTNHTRIGSQRIDLSKVNQILKRQSKSSESTKSARPSSYPQRRPATPTATSHRAQSSSAMRRRPSFK